MSVRISALSAFALFLCSIPITWRAGPHIEIMPRSLLYSGVKAGSEIESHLILESYLMNEESVSVVAVEIDGEAVPFHTSPLNKTEQVSLRISFKHMMPKSSGVNNREVCIFTDDGRDIPIKVPLTLLVE